MKKYILLFIVSFVLVACDKGEMNFFKDETTKKKSNKHVTTETTTATGIYTALMYQFSTGDPTAEVLENSIGSIVWTRIGIGNYRGTLTGAFPEVKTVFFITNNVGPAVTHLIDWWDENTVFMNTFIGTERADGQLQNTTIRIETYP